MKLVVNKCYGGYSISPEAALALYAQGMTEIATPVDKYYGGKDEGPFGKTDSLAKWRAYLAAPRHNQRGSMFITTFSPDEQFVLDIRPPNRADPRLVAIVEEMGDAANGACAALAITEIPDGVEYEIEEYDGQEWVAEAHRTW